MPAADSHPLGEGARVPRWAAVVLYYRSPDTIVETLRSLLQQTLPPCEVVVVDNDSRDGLEARLAAAEVLSSVRVQTAKTNGGYAVGMNSGRAALATAPDAVFFLTHEVVLEPECARLLANAVLHGSLALAGPELRLPSGMTWSAGGLLTRRGDAFHAIAPTPDGRCAWVDGAAIMADLEVFDELDGFDPAFFLYWEDVDLGVRLTERSLGAVGCVSAARAVQTTGTAPIEVGVSNRILMWRLHRSPWMVALTIAEIAIKIVAKDLTRARWSAARARWRGIRRGLRTAHAPRANRIIGAQIGSPEVQEKPQA